LEANDMDKQWLCKHGHVLGAIQWNGNKVPFLLLYRHAVDMGADDPEAVDVIGPVIGQMPVRCDICDQVRTWEMTPKILAEFLKTMNKGERELVEAYLHKGHVRKTNKIMNRARVEK